MGFLRKIFKKNNPENIDLDYCIREGLLSKEEKLRIERDRAIEEWQKESDRITGKKKRKK